MASEIFTIREHLQPCNYIRQYHRGTANSQEEILSICVKQYTPTDQPAELPPDAITIIGAHANGFPKELYEPLWIEMYHRLRAAGKHIRAIWIADSAWQGQSSVVNRSKLGNDPSWFDHSRDLLLMINNFQSEIRRPIVGVGHSMGAVQLLHLSLLHPRLFTTLVILDPILIPRPDPRNYIPAQMSISRREEWSSRSQARESFLASKFYKSWDERVLALWLQFGLRNCTEAAETVSSPGGEKEKSEAVTLTTTKHQEVASFLRYNAAKPPGYERTWRTPDLVPAFRKGTVYRPEPVLTFERLPDIRPSVFYIFGRSSMPNPPSEREEKVARTGIGTGGSGGEKAGRVMSTVVDTGHLVAMERPGDVARCSVEWIVDELEVFNREEEVVRKEWFEGVGADEKSKVDPLLERELRRGAKGKL